jgi:hypothetical protein
MKKLETLHIPIYKNNRIIHVATVRSDWNEYDFESFRGIFDGCSIVSKNTKCPAWLIGKKDHGTDFNHLKKYSA